MRFSAGGTRFRADHEILLAPPHGLETWKDKLVSRCSSHCFDHASWTLLSEVDQQRTIDGIKTMAVKIPGIKNVWLKTERNQLRDFSGVYAIEFASPDAAADYAESKVHEAWSKQWLEQRETSLSFQVSNP